MTRKGAFGVLIRKVALRCVRPLGNLPLREQHGWFWGLSVAHWKTRVAGGDHQDGEVTEKLMSPFEKPWTHNQTRDFSTLVFSSFKNKTFFFHMSSLGYLQIWRNTWMARVGLNNHVSSIYAFDTSAKDWLFKMSQHHCLTRQAFPKESGFDFFSPPFSPRETPNLKSSTSSGLCLNDQITYYVQWGEIQTNYFQHWRQNHTWSSLNNNRSDQQFDDMRLRRFITGQ